MKALVETHAALKNVSLRDLFRACYMAAFQKDISSISLDEDLSAFRKHGITPKYVIRYFLNLLGAKN